MNGISGCSVSVWGGCTDADGNVSGRSGIGRSSRRQREALTIAGFALAKGELDYPAAPNSRVLARGVLVGC